MPLLVLVVAVVVAPVTVACAVLGLFSLYPPAAVVSRQVTVQMMQEVVLPITDHCHSVTMEKSQLSITR